jgi:hypothetical protein
MDTALLMTESARYFLAGRTIELQIALITFTIGIPAVLFGWGWFRRNTVG